MSSKLPIPVPPMPKKFKVSGLTLDVTNPRFGGKALTERQSINRLANDAKARPKLYALARDIMARGQMNPAELPMIVLQGKTRIVAEGNRRVIALRLLQNPMLATDASVQRRFQQIKAESDYLVPDTMLCVPFNSWEEANPWIVLRHTGANGGVGVDDWNSAQATRFADLHDPKKKTSSQEGLELLLSSTFSDDENLLDLISKVRAKQNTTLGRLLLPHHLDLLGLAAHNDGLVLITSQVEKFRALWTSILTDLLTVRDVKNGELSWSRYLNSKEERNAYIKTKKNQLPHIDQNLLNEVRLASDSDKPVAKTAEANKPVPQNTSANAAKESSGAAASGSGTYTPSPANPPAHVPLEDFLFASVDFSGFSERLRTLGASAQKIRISQLTDVAGVILRVTLELCVNDYLNRHAKKIEGRLDRDLKTVLFHLDPNVRSPREVNDQEPGADLHNAFIRISGQDGFAIRTMHGYVHGILLESSPSEVRSISRMLTPVLNRMSRQLASGHGERKEA